MDETTAQLRKKMNDAIGRNNDQVKNVAGMCGKIISPNMLSSEILCMQVQCLNNQSLIMRMLMRISSSDSIPKY